MAQQQQRSKLDTELPTYPVEAAACAALSKGGTGSISYDPFKVSGLVPEPSLEINGAVVPRTPLFLFYADHQATFFPQSISFSPSMRCAVNSGLDKNGQMEFTHLPDGNYIVFIFASRLVTWHGTTSSRGYGYDMFGGPVTTTTETPVSGQTRHTRIYGQKFDLRGGKVSNSTDPFQLLDW